jgi:hypothetical protein
LAPLLVLFLSSIKGRFPAGILFQLQARFLVSILFSLTASSTRMSLSEAAGCFRIGIQSTSTALFSVVILLSSLDRMLSVVQSLIMASSRILILLRFPGSSRGAVLSATTGRFNGVSLLPELACYLGLASFPACG